MLDSASCRATNVPVRMIQIRPGLVDGVRMLPQVERLEHVASRLQLARIYFFASGSRRFIADIRHAIQARLAVSPTDDEVHCPIDRIDDDVCEGQGSSGDEILQLAGEGGAARLEMGRVHFSE